jgi:hypothetical protein
MEEHNHKTIIDEVTKNLLREMHPESRVAIRDKVFATGTKQEITVEVVNEDVEIAKEQAVRVYIDLKSTLKPYGGSDGTD